MSLNGRLCPKFSLEQKYSKQILKMSAPIKQSDFPKYFQEGTKLLAFVEKDKMFKIEPIGSNKNPGVTIDHYITRNMVLKHFPGKTAKELSKQQFADLLRKLYGSYIDKIIEW